MRVRRRSTWRTRWRSRRINDWVFSIGYDTLASGCSTRRGRVRGPRINEYAPEPRRDSSPHARGSTLPSHHPARRTDVASVQRPAASATIRATRNGERDVARRNGGPYTVTFRLREHGHDPPRSHGVYVVAREPLSTARSRSRRRRTAIRDRHTPTRPCGTSPATRAKFYCLHPPIGTDLQRRQRRQPEPDLQGRRHRHHGHRVHLLPVTTRNRR